MRFSVGKKINTIVSKNQTISTKKYSFFIKILHDFLAPVRLITNQGEGRIMLRRRIADCAVLANRVEVLLDDLLWILTDRQIQAAVLCVKSLTDSIEASKRQQMSLQRSNSDMSIMSDITVTNPQANRILKFLKTYFENEVF